MKLKELVMFLAAMMMAFASAVDVFFYSNIFD
jgi:hypothetical protein